jgi:hypothetical protein
MYIYLAVWSGDCFSQMKAFKNKDIAENQLELWMKKSVKEAGWKLPDPNALPKKIVKDWDEITDGEEVLEIRRLKVI